MGNDAVSVGMTGRPNNKEEAFRRVRRVGFMSEMNCLPFRCHWEPWGVYICVFMYVFIYVCVCVYLRLRERGRMAGDLLPSSSVMLSELKCLVRKCSSSAVGWKGSWCSFSWDEHDDCEKQRGRDYKGRRHGTSCGDGQPKFDRICQTSKQTCCSNAAFDLTRKC